MKSHRRPCRSRFWFRAAVPTVAVLFLATGCKRDRKTSTDGTKNKTAKTSQNAQTPTKGQAVTPSTADRKARWAQVVEWAKPGVKPAKHGELKRALELIRPHHHRIRRETTRAAKSNNWRVSPEALPAAAKEALSLFVKWYRTSGGLERRPCRARTNVFGMMVLARAALATAGDTPSEPQVEAVLYLAHRLRQEGRSLIEAMVGVALAARAVTWAKARKQPPGPAFSRYKPSDRAILRALAADAVCTVELGELLRGDKGAVDRAQLAKHHNVSDPSRVTALIETEIRAVRRYEIELVHGSNRLWNNREKMIEFLKTSADRAKARSRSYLLKTVVIHLNRYVQRFFKQHDAYHEFIKSGTARPPTPRNAPRTTPRTAR